MILQWRSPTWLGYYDFAAHKRRPLPVDASTNHFAQECDEEV